MKGCKMDTDGDGNCPLHPVACPADMTDVNYGPGRIIATMTPAPSMGGVVTHWAVAKDQLAKYEAMGALDVGDGVVEVHHSAVNHEPHEVVPPPGTWQVTRIDNDMVWTVKL